MPLKNSGFGASKLVTTKTLLLKHYCRHQGKFAISKILRSSLGQAQSTRTAKFDHELFHECAHENARGSTHEDVHGNAHEG